MSDDVRDIFHEQLLKYMNIRGKSQTDISRDLNISLTTVSGWYRGKNFPRPDKMQLLADYLQVKVENLIKKDSDEFLDDTSNIRGLLEKLPNKALAKMFDKTKDLTEEEVEQILQIIEIFEKKK